MDVGEVEDLEGPLGSFRSELMTLEALERGTFKCRS